MSTAHSQEHTPDSMAGGITRLIIVITFAVIASSLWYFGGKPLTNKHGGSHGQAQEAKHH
jgi:hypothetical protein